MFTGEPSGLFAPIYVCPEHGQIWQIEIETVIDTDQDDVYNRRCCPKCRRDVTPLLHDGNPVLHPLTDEEAYWETSSPFDEPEDDEDEYEPTPWDIDLLEEDCQ